MSTEFFNTKSLAHKQLNASCWREKFSYQCLEIRGELADNLD